MRVTKFVFPFCMLVMATGSHADVKCEAHAKTRDDYLLCDSLDTEKALGDAEKLYLNIKRNLPRDKVRDFIFNHKIWDDRIKSDCMIVADAFNNWTADYTPDTDFQISACRSNIAKEELEFYKRISCPEDMEKTGDPKCEKINKMLGSADR